MIVNFFLQFYQYRRSCRQLSSRWIDCNSARLCLFADCIRPIRCTLARNKKCWLYVLLASARAVFILPFSSGNAGSWVEKRSSIGCVWLQLTLCRDDYVGVGSPVGWGVEGGTNGTSLCAYSTTMHIIRIQLPHTDHWHTLTPPRNLDYSSASKMFRWIKYCLRSFASGNYGQAVGLMVKYKTSIHRHIV